MSKSDWTNGMTANIQVVWFKRDLRIADHKPLYEAAQQGRVLPLYIAEPSLHSAPDFDSRHWEFIAASLAELQQKLATLQGVPEDQIEAARIDGANTLQRFRHITIPTIMPVVVVSTLFSLVRTFAEMEIVWILTKGGPFNNTHMIGTYAYQVAIKNAKIGEGAAVSLFFFPVMVAIVVFQLWYLQRRNN